MSPAPKDRIENARYRRSILEHARGDVEFQRECWIRASRDVVWWIDTFCYTYSPKDYPEAPHRAFILYPYQEEAVHRVQEAFGRHDLLIEKSRDMGATWIVMAAIDHAAIFRRGQSFLLGSRKQELVDKPGDPKSLFWKLDYLNDNLPGWMRPNLDRTSLHCHFKNTNSTIDGESTNDDFARGDRRTAIPLDEFPAVDNGHQILAATRDATNCRIFIGTPQGASGAYYDTRVKMQDANPERILTLHWTLHPEKSAGLYTTVEEKEGGELLILDPEFPFPPDYPFIRDGRKRSPWYDEQERRAATKQELAQEVDIDYAASGWQYFDAKMLANIKKETARAPLHSGELVLNPDWRKPGWISQPGARLQLWFHPDDQGRVPGAWDDCVIGCDVATGKGGEMSSNSVASVARKSTGEKIAQFTTNQMSPSDFCHAVLGMCTWFNQAHLIWEENGPGGEFTKQVKERGYRDVYYRNDNELKFNSRKTRKPGWWSNKETKKILLAEYRNALFAGKFVNHSEEALDECGQYVMNPNETVEHNRSKKTSDVMSLGENHGDMVIADALCWLAISETTRSGEEEAMEMEPPPGSFAARRKRFLREVSGRPVYGRKRRTAAVSRDG